MEIFNHGISKKLTPGLVTIQYLHSYYIYNPNNIPILTFSNKYRELQNELFKHTNTQPYYQLWKNRNIYL